MGSHEEFVRSLAACLGQVVWCPRGDKCEIDQQHLWKRASLSDSHHPWAALSEMAVYHSKLIRLSGFGIAQKDIRQAECEVHRTSNSDFNDTKCSGGTNRP